MDITPRYDGRLPEIKRETIAEKNANAVRERQAYFERRRVDRRDEYIEEIRNALYHLTNEDLRYMAGEYPEESLRLVSQLKAKG